MALGACHGRSAGDNGNNDNGNNDNGNNGNGNDAGVDCVFECDALHEPSLCVDGTQVRYCQELIHCGTEPPYGGEWYTVACENACEHGISMVPDATELVFEHCGDEQVEVTDGPGSCWCRDPHSDTLYFVHPMYGLY